jgi:Peptidase family M28/PA domain
MKGRIAVWTGALAVAALLGATPTGGAGKDDADEVLTTIRPEAIRAAMRFLADDLLEGRGTGTRGHEIAAKFMASEFEAMGLEPAGDNGTYFQRVPLRSIQPDEEHTTLSIVRGRLEQPLIFGKDFVPVGDVGRQNTSAEAPVVYVGFGVTAPEQGYDDYAGLEVKGKIVAYLYGAPARFESTMRAHYSSSTAKAANAAAHGALGTILLDSPDLERLYPFKERVGDLAFPQMRWLNSGRQPNDYFPELRAAAILSMDATAKMFEGSGKSPEEIYRAAKEGRTFSRALPLDAKIKTVSKFQEIHSPNVMGRLRGSDSRLRDEHVVYTAHLDHLGIGEPVNGDKIYNGALDNASGSACLLEIARAYSQMRKHPRRSILFLSVTAEEEGLLGSDYFAHYPPMSKDSLVADINMDGAALLWPIEDIVARGAEHSSLGVAVQEAAARLKIDVSPDPSPEQVLFIRSDQHSFVKQGIPSLFLSPGLRSSNPKIKPAEIRMTWIATRYHKPQDDMDQPLDFDSGAKYARYSFLVGYVLAQQDKKPEWNPGDFFDDHYGKKARNVPRIERLLSVLTYRDRLRN